MHVDHLAGGHRDHSRRSVPFNTSAKITFSPTAEANCNPITCSPVSRSFFPLGTTTVKCTSAAGPTCSFTVTVNSLCLQDETNPGNLVLVNGRGTLNVKGCEGTIEHNKGERRVFISWDTTANGGKGAGTASVQLPVNNTRCQITDKDMSNNSCTPPQVTRPKDKNREP